MKQFFKRKTILAGLIFTFIALLAFPSQAKAMTADQYQHCIDNTHDIESRKYVCNLCRDGRAYSTQGAAWINDDRNDSWKKDISIDGTAYENNETITLYLRGGFYACGTNDVPGNVDVYGYAAGIYTQELHGGQNNNLLLKDAVVSPANNGTWQFYRGKGIEGHAYVWNDEIYDHLENGGKQKFEIKVKARSFMNGSVSCGSDPKKGECREKSIYIFRCMHYLNYWQATNTCGTSTVRVRAYISYKKVTEDPGNADTKFTDSANKVCPLGAADSGPYYGNTLSRSQVDRYDYKDGTATITKTVSIPSSGALSASGGEGRIFLKPNDHVRFKHTLCFGVQGLKDAQAANKKTFFTLTTNNDSFKTSIVNNTKITLDTGVKRPSQLKDATGTKIVSTLNDYSFTEVSPHGKIGYTVAANDVGKMFEQSFTHNTLRGYIKWRSKKSGSCGCNKNTAKITHSENMSYGAAVKAQSNYVWGYVKGYKCTTGGKCSCTCSNGTAPDKCHAWSCKTMYKYNTQERTFTKKYENTTATATKTLTAYVPYNFTTKTFSKVNSTNGSTINFELGYQKQDKKVTGISSAAYSTILPSTKKYRIITFAVPSSVRELNKEGNNNADLGKNPSAEDLCAIFDIQKSSCEMEKHGSKDVTDDTNKHSIDHSYTIPDDAEVGTKYCAAIAFYPSDSLNHGGHNADNLINIAMKGGSTWNVSNAVCNTISRKPTFQVWNGGIYSPKIDTYSSEYNDKTFGSWSEQLVIASGGVSSFASGAAYGYGSGYNFGLPGGSSSADIKDNSPLTVANSEDTIGNSGFTIDNNIVQQLRARFNVSNLPNRGTSNLGPVSPPSDGSNVVVIRSTGTLTIDQDIFFSGDANNPLRLINQDTTGRSFSSAAELPQVLIFANHIKILGSVSRIDAWLIADGTINTCPTAGTCDNHLIINGPVFAKNLKLNRTAGGIEDGIHESSDDPRMQDLTNDGVMTPAEVFNLRPDAYLWAYSQTGGFSDVSTAYIRELAPRY